MAAQCKEFDGTAAALGIAWRLAALLAGAGISAAAVYLLLGVLKWATP